MKRKLIAFFALILFIYLVVPSIYIFTSGGFFGKIVFLIIFFVAIYLFNKAVKKINGITPYMPTTKRKDTIVLSCKKCGSVLKVDDKVCPKCGEPFEGDNVLVETKPFVAAKVSDFDPMFAKSEKALLVTFIKRELKKADIDARKLIPEKVLQRKTIFNIIFSILVFIYTVLIFFHFPLTTYYIGVLILLLLFLLIGRYSFIKYLVKEVKSRPGEKISNIIMYTKNSLVVDRLKLVRPLITLTSIALALLLFNKPRILYEKVDGGYAVRYYAFGLSNYKTVEIPATYKGKNVVALRGNAFSNMFYLESAILPDTIKEIRGQAFKNDKRLTSVKLPSKLEYLGGGAFQNCTSLTKIELPDTLTYLGGESFSNATHLKSIKLSNSLTEIRGHTFDKCYSLQSIEIPDSVTRIGGRAFYDNRSLTEVTISENSRLFEIGSSAFRECIGLKKIVLPKYTIVNERAFKNSPTVIYRYNLRTNTENAHE